MTRYFLATAVLLCAAQAASANGIEQACMRSDRSQATAQRCGCVQDVANLTLTAPDQRRAARFFTDPREAQQVRQSSNYQDRVFWKRYQLFADSASTYCS